MTTFEAILLTIVTASTPLLIAAIGELVAERAGVLNLGVEGMMAMGAACSFAAASASTPPSPGSRPASSPGAGMAALFAFVVLGLAANQVGSGLALTILGLGLSGLIGAPFVGARRDPIAHVHIPGLTDLPGGRPPPLRRRTPSSMRRSRSRRRSRLFLNRTRAGLTLRAVGENHVSAHALGLPVLRTRFLAILFGGACAGLAGAYLSLVYTRFWSPGMTAGRGWIALALVVFAAWRPAYALAGAYLFGAATVLQLHAQAAPVRIAVAASLGRALPGDDPDPRPALDRPRPGHRRAGVARRAVRAGSLKHDPKSRYGSARKHPRASARAASRSGAVSSSRKERVQRSRRLNSSAVQVQARAQAGALRPAEVQVRSHWRRNGAACAVGPGGKSSARG